MIVFCYVFTYASHLTSSKIWPCALASRPHKKGKKQLPLTSGLKKRSLVGGGVSEGVRCEASSRRDRGERTYVRDPLAQGSQRCRLPLITRRQSTMDAFPVCHLHRLQKALRQGRVRMNGMHDIVRGNLLLPNHHRFGNHFRHVFAHHVASQE